MSNILRATTNRLHGSFRRSAVFLALVSLPALVQADGLPAAASRYEAWRGGLPFTRVQSLHAVGHLSMGGLKGRIEKWSCTDGRVRQEVDLGAVRQHQAITGSTGWTTTLGGQVQPLPDAERLDATREAVSLYDGVLRGAFGAVLTARPQEGHDGQPCEVFRIAYGDGGTYDYLVAPATGQLLALRAVAGGRTQVTRFTDWRLVNGVRMPYCEETTGASSGDNTSITYTEIALDPSLAEALFASPPSVSPLTFAKGASSSGWLAFELFAGTRIFIPIVVNGHPTIAMLDSGASATVLDRRFAASLGLESQGTLTGQGGGGATAYGVVHGVDLKLGDLALNGGTAVAIDLTAVERQIGHPMPVILGGELFRDAVVELDFQGHRLAFRDPASFQAPADARAVALTPSDENQAIVAMVEGRPARLLFDLGNGAALSLYPRFWEQPAFSAGRRTSTTMTGGVGGMAVEKLAMVTKLTLGGGTFQDLPAALESRGSSLDARSGRLDGNLGMGVLSRFHLTIDFPHARVLFAPPIDAATPFEVNHAGLTLQPGAMGSKVLHVAPASPAAAAGLRTDDVIVSVDDARVGAQEPGTRGWLFGPVGKQLRLKLADGQVRLLTLAKYF